VIPEDPHGKIVALEERFQILDLGRPSDVHPERREHPEGRIFPLVLDWGGDHRGCLVDVREQEHHEERHEPHCQGEQDDLPPVLAEDGEIFPQVDFDSLGSRGGVVVSHDR